MAKLKLGVQISGRGSNLQALIDACQNPNFPAEIVLVVSNIPEAQGLERAKQAGIPTQVIAHKNYPSKKEFEEALDAAHRSAGVELICNAGFMRIISPFFVARWRGRMINIHPSFLPAYPGLHTHKRALEEKAAHAGCSVHYVEEEVDAGAIILQTKVPVEAGDTEETLAARVLKEEHRIYPEAVRLIATGAVRYQDGKVLRAAKAAMALMLFVLPLFGAPAMAQEVYDDHDHDHGDATATKTDEPHAAEMKIREEMGMPVEWVLCDTSEECTVVSLPCGPSIGVHTDHKAEAEKAVCDTYKNCQTGCDGSAVLATSAICEQGECFADYKQ